MRARRHSSDHPFFTGRYLNHPTYALDADSRIHMVRKFDETKCRAALRFSGLQVTVRKAIERRLRELERTG